MTDGPSQPAPAFSIQSAKAEHAFKIRDLVRRAGINPTALKWKRFLIAITPKGEFIGCGQVKPHSDGTWELASLAVEPIWRGRGVARAIIQSLITSNPGELYLMCQSNLGTMYEKFGFQALTESETPTYFRRVSKLVSLAIILARAGERLLVMRRPPTGDA
jgi:N-acetylglutamate synthase-like GNAT family acetyltransferase